jgi:hypothetical protein
MDHRPTIAGLRVHHVTSAREHLHHIFTVAGYSNNATLLIILGISLTLSIVGIIANRYLGIPEPILFWIFMLLFLGYYCLMSYAWKVMKISRYLRDTRITDRRDDNQRKQDGQRSVADRRYIPSKHELEKFYKASGLMAGLLRQPFRKNAVSAKKNTTKDDAEILANEYAADDKKSIPTEKTVDHDTENQNSSTSKPTESRNLLAKSVATI